MPMYDYHCESCGNEFEDFRKLDDKTPVMCPKCGKEARKMVSVVGFTIHNTLATRRRAEQAAEDAHYEAELKQRFNLRGIQRRNRSTMKEVYQDAMMQEGLVKEQMAADAERKAAQTKKKQDEWKREALKRTPQRAREMKERKAKEAYNKRKISL